MRQETETTAIIEVRRENNQVKCVTLCTVTKQSLDDIVCNVIHTDYDM